MRKAILFSLIITFTYLVDVSAEELTSKNKALIGFSLLDMHYKEFEDSGFLLDREDGLLPGVTLELVNSTPRHDNIFYASYHASTIDYDGHTQTLIPVKTDTKTNIIDVQYRLSEKSTEQNQLYGGIGYRYWRRDIQSTVIPNGAGFLLVEGLLEHYQWLYGLLGVKTRISSTPHSEVSADFRITHMLMADIDIALAKFGCPDTTLDLGKKTNFRLGLPWKIKSANSYNWVVEPYFEQWDIGKSNTAIIQCFDGPASILEPRSETRNWGVNIQMVMPF